MSHSISKKTATLIDIFLLSKNANADDRVELFRTARRYRH
jgi:hypothetical protein